MPISPQVGYFLNAPTNHPWVYEDVNQSISQSVNQSIRSSRFIFLFKIIKSLFPLNCVNNSKFLEPLHSLCMGKHLISKLSSHALLYQKRQQLFSLFPILTSCASMHINVSTCGILFAHINFLRTCRSYAGPLLGSNKYKIKELLLGICAVQSTFSVVKWYAVSPDIVWKEAK